MLELHSKSILADDNDYTSLFEFKNTMVEKDFDDYKFEFEFSLSNSNDLLEN